MEARGQAANDRTGVPGMSEVPPPTAPRKVPAGVRASEDDRQKLWVGGFMLVLLLPVLIALGADPPEDWVGWVTVSPFVAVGLYSGGGVGLGIRGRARRRRTYRTGIPVVATVTDLQTLVSDQGDGEHHESIHIRWEFSVDGTTVGGDRWSKGDRIREVEEGESIWVLYDVTNPNKNVEWPPL